MTRIESKIKRLSEHSLESGAKFIGINPSNIGGVDSKVTFQCSCGLTTSRDSYPFLKKPAKCFVCLKEVGMQKLRISEKVVQALLDSEQAKLVELSVVDSKTLVTYLCKCGVSVTRPWAVLQNKNLRTKPKCISCSLAERKYLRGENHPLYNPVLDRSKQDYRWHQTDEIWSKQVLSRFDFKCAITGESSNKLAAHHLLSRTRFPEFRYNVLNGVSIKRSLHTDFHRKFGRFKFTPQDFQTFFFELTGQEFTLPDKLKIY